MNGDARKSRTLEMVNELYHHGIKGQKWGVRRFQNSDGTLTPAGQKRRAKEIDRQLGRLQQDTARLEAQYHNASGGIKRSYNKFNKYRTKYEGLSDEQKASWRGRRLKKKGKDWLTRSFESAAIAYVSNDKMQKNKEQTHKLLQQIQNDPNLLTYQQRRAAGTYFTKGDKNDAGRMLNAAGLNGKKVRRTYDNNYANTTIYDRTRVRYASDKERRKNKKRRTEWKDSELQRIEYYYI